LRDLDTSSARFLTAKPWRLRMAQGQRAITVRRRQAVTLGEHR
jgi:hypothetical protein